MFDRSTFTTPHMVAREAPYHKAAETEPSTDGARAPAGMLTAGHVVWTREPLRSAATSRFVLGYLENVGAILIAAHHLQPCSSAEPAHLSAGGSA